MGCLRVSCQWAMTDPALRLHHRGLMVKIEGTPDSKASPQISSAWHDTSLRRKDGKEDELERDRDLPVLAASGMGKLNTSVNTSSNRIHSSVIESSDTKMDTSLFCDSLLFY